MQEEILSFEESPTRFFTPKLEMVDKNLQSLIVKNLQKSSKSKIFMSTF